MSAMRSKMRSRLTRASARASGRADARVDAEPEPEVVAAVGAVEAELGRRVEVARVAVRGAVVHHHRRARGDVDAADGRREPCEPELALDRALEPQHLLDEVGDAVPFGAQQLLELGILGEPLQRGAEEPRGRLAARREQVRGDEGDVVHVGDRPVGEGRGGEPGHDVVARCAPELLDVGGEPVVEELQRLVRHRAAARLPGGPVVALQLRAERLVVGFRDAEQVGDHQQRERLRVVAARTRTHRGSTNSSIVRSASCHMNSSFSFRRFGVISRSSSPRCSVCFGGSNDGS